MQFVKLYDQSLRQNPLKTKICTALILGLSADTVCQHIQFGRYESVERSIRQGFIGACILSPTMHLYFKLVLPYFSFANCKTKTSCLRLVMHLLLVTPYM